MRELPGQSRLSVPRSGLQHLVCRIARRGLIPRTAVMVYAPRDQTELEVVERLIRESYDFARGSDPTR